MNCCTAGSVDAFIIVVEPGQRSLQTARSVNSLARDIGVNRCYLVGSKTRDDADRSFIIENTPDFEVLGFINYNPEIAQADLRGLGVFQAAPGAVADARRIKERLDQLSQGEGR